MHFSALDIHSYPIFKRKLIHKMYSYWYSPNFTCNFIVFLLLSIILSYNFYGFFIFFVCLFIFFLSLYILSKSWNLKMKRNGLSIPLLKETLSLSEDIKQKESNPKQQILRNLIKPKENPILTNYHEIKDDANDELISFFAKEYLSKSTFAKREKSLETSTNFLKSTSSTIKLLPKSNSIEKHKIYRISIKKLVIKKIKNFKKKFLSLKKKRNFLPDSKTKSK